MDSLALQKQCGPKVSATAPAGTYQYQPLEKDHYELRLLQLLPLTESPDEPLQCRLKHVSLKTVKVSKQHDVRGSLSVNYEAISYCWGDPTRSRVIIIDSKTLLLPVNSEKSLRRMAFSDRSRVVLLDAVCVNQDDPAERTAQVLLMKDIFRHAQATLVYLGDSVDSTAQAFANLRHLHLEFQEDAQARGGKWKVLSNHSSGDNRLNTCINEDALIELFQRPWFTRAWVVQEVALSTRSSIVCGSEEIDMVLVLAVVRWITANYFRYIPRMLINSFVVISSTWEACDRLALGLSCTVYSNLVHGRDLHATDPRDKVFGMLGLLNEKKTNHKLLDPDYTKQVSDVFRDAVRHCIAYGLGLGILGNISHREDAHLAISGSPSWVPNFDHPRNCVTETVPFINYLGPECLGDMILADKMRASASIDEPNVLLSLGVDMCSVQAVSVAFRLDEEIEDLARHDEMLRWYESVAAMTQSCGIPETAIARTLVADTERGTLEPYKNPLSGQTAFLHLIRNHVVVPSDADLDSNLNANTLAEVASRFISAMHAWCSNRKFAIMSNGTTSLVPQLTVPGDLVVMTHGGTIPLVLRPHGEYFLMLGECYVDGWMRWQEHRDELQEKMLNTEPTTYRIK